MLISKYGKTHSVVKASEGVVNAHKLGFFQIESKSLSKRLHRPIMNFHS